MDFATTLLQCLCIPGSVFDPSASTSTNTPTKNEQRGAITEKPLLHLPPQATAQTAPSDPEADAMITKIIDILRSAEKPGFTLTQSLDDAVGATGWPEWLAQRVLKALEETLKSSRDNWGPALREAYETAIVVSSELFVELAQYVKDHPKEVAAGVLVTLLAIGVMAVLTPWVLELLGFGVEGPVADSFAAWFQSTYRGFVPKGSLMSYLQRLGMTWGRSGVLLAKI